MKAIYNTLDEKAEKLLKKSEALSLPVNLNTVIDYLGLSMIERPLEEEFSGFLAVEEKTIVINSLHAQVRKRFSTAHEVGHYVLHKSKSPDSHVFIDQTIYYRRESDSGNAIDCQMEMEANAFAAGLLMPSVLLEEYLEKHPEVDLRKTSDIKLIADEFEASRPAMEYRLRNLGFLLPTSF